MENANNGNKVVCTPAAQVTLVTEETTVQVGDVKAIGPPEREVAEYHRVKLPVPPAVKKLDTDVKTAGNVLLFCTTKDIPPDPLFPEYPIPKVWVLNEITCAFTDAPSVENNTTNKKVL